MFKCEEQQQKLIIYIVKKMILLVEYVEHFYFSHKLLVTFLQIAKRKSRKIKNFLLFYKV